MNHQDHQDHEDQKTKNFVVSVVLTIKSLLFAQIWRRQFPSLDKEGSKGVVEKVLKGSNPLLPSPLSKGEEPGEVLSLLGCGFCRAVVFVV